MKSAPRLGALDRADQEINLYISDFFTRRWGENTAALHISGAGKRIGSLQLVRTNEDTQRYPYFYHSDLPSGSVTAVTRSAGVSAFQGELIERLEYAPYGQLIKRSRTIGPVAQGPDTNSSDVPPLSGDEAGDRRLPLYAYAGKELDLETGYSYFGARYYDSESYLWLNADPVSHRSLCKPVELSSYFLAGANPIANIDLTGGTTISEAWTKLQEWLNTPISEQKYLIPDVDSCRTCVARPELADIAWLEEGRVDYRQYTRRDVVRPVLAALSLVAMFAGPALRSAGAAGDLAGFSSAEIGVVGEAQSIVRAPEFAQLAAAHQAGELAVVNIGGRMI